MKDNDNKYTLMNIYESYKHKLNNSNIIRQQNNNTYMNCSIFNSNNLDLIDINNNDVNNLLNILSNNENKLNINDSKEINNKKTSNISNLNSDNLINEINKDNKLNNINDSNILNILIESKYATSKTLLNKNNLIESALKLNSYIIFNLNNNNNKKDFNKFKSTALLNNNLTLLSGNIDDYLSKSNIDTSQNILKKNTYLNNSLLKRKTISVSSNYSRIIIPKNLYYKTN